MIKRSKITKVAYEESESFDNIYRDVLYLLERETKNSISEEKKENEEEEENDNDEDDNINRRNKDKERIELENRIKNKLSTKTVKTINKNEKEIDEIIDSLKNTGIEHDGNGISLSQLKSKRTQRQRSL